MHITPQEVKFSLIFPSLEPPILLIIIGGLQQHSPIMSLKSSADFQLPAVSNIWSMRLKRFDSA
jgi:hypothetical protein